MHTHPCTVVLNLPFVASLHLDAKREAAIAQATNRQLQQSTSKRGAGSRLYSATASSAIKKRVALGGLGGSSGVSGVTPAPPSATKGFGGGSRRFAGPHSLYDVEVVDSVGLSHEEWRDFRGGCLDKTEQQQLQDAQQQPPLCDQQLLPQPTRTGNITALQQRKRAPRAPGRPKDTQSQLPPQKKSAEANEEAGQESDEQGGSSTTSGFYHTSGQAVDDAFPQKISQSNDTLDTEHAMVQQLLKRTEVEHKKQLAQALREQEEKLVASQNEMRRRLEEEKQAQQKDSEQAMKKIIAECQEAWVVMQGFRKEIKMGQERIDELEGMLAKERQQRQAELVRELAALKRKYEADLAQLRGLHEAQRTTALAQLQREYNAEILANNQKHSAQLKEKNNAHAHEIEDISAKLQSTHELEIATLRNEWEEQVKSATERAEAAWKEKQDHWNNEMLDQKSAFAQLQAEFHALKQAHAAQQAAQAQQEQSRSQELNALEAKHRLEVEAASSQVAHNLESQQRAVAEAVSAATQEVKAVAGAELQTLQAQAEARIATLTTRQQQLELALQESKHLVKQHDESNVALRAECDVARERFSIEIARVTEDLANATDALQASQNQVQIMEASLQELHQKLQNQTDDYQEQKHQLQEQLALAKAEAETATSNIVAARSITISTQQSLQLAEAKVVELELAARRSTSVSETGTQTAEPTNAAMASSPTDKVLAGDDLSEQMEKYISTVASRLGVAAGVLCSIAVRSGLMPASHPFAMQCRRVELPQVGVCFGDTCRVVVLDATGAASALLYRLQVSFQGHCWQLRRSRADLDAMHASLTEQGGIPEDILPSLPQREVPTAKKPQHRRSSLLKDLFTPGKSKKTGGGSHGEACNAEGTPLKVVADSVGRIETYLSELLDDFPIDQVLRWLQVMSCTDKVVVQILQEDRRASRHMATPTTDNLTPRKQQPLSPGSRRRSEILSAVVGGSSSATTAANHGPSSTQHSDTTAAWHFTLRVSQHGKIWTIERSYSQLVALHEGLLREGQRCQQRYRVPALPPSGCTRMQIQDYLDAVNQLDIAPLRGAFHSFLEVEEKDR
eukprot:INCI14704.7.p1 GENE.INCI14704.7~~INCI14704.7.p1  ORF type:complete len:1080 (+),score=250.83 INCI14704.7:536-3775(+)